MSLAGLSLTYRIDTLTSEGTTSQGRDQTYGLPALALRVLSLVPGGARDIRDASTLTFADLETRRFRARALGILGWVLYALAGAVVALAVVRAYGALGAPAKAAIVAGLGPGDPAARQPRAVRGDAGASGRGLDRRAGGARRRGAAGRRRLRHWRPGGAEHRPGGHRATDGQLALSQGVLRRRHALVSSSVTPADLAGRRDRRRPAAGARRPGRGDRGAVRPRRLDEARSRAR